MQYQSTGKRGDGGMETTVLQSVGDYRITSEKEDECLPNWRAAAHILAVVVGVCTFLAISISYPMTYTGVPPDYTVVYIEAFAGITLTAFLFVIPFLYQDCGVIIRLKTPPDEYDLSTTYQFTSNPEKDAVKIKEIAEGYAESAKTMINQKRTRAERENEQKQLCCTRYQNVMEKLQQ
jgi:hypothetical protein